MFTQLPEHLDPWRSAERGLAFSGVVPVRELPRLRDLLLVLEGEVGYQIRFERDERGRPQIRGRVTTELVVECQRCLRPLSLPVVAELRLVVVRALEEVCTLEDPFEPLLVESGLFSPLELIEEELLLALPHVPLHTDPDCRAPALPGDDAALPEAVAAPIGGPESPFAVLADLKIPTKH